VKCCKAARRDLWKLAVENDLERATHFNNAELSEDEPHPPCFSYGVRRATLEKQEPSWIIGIQAAKNVRIEQQPHL
jgi:hypothetical protein